MRATERLGTGLAERVPSALAPRCVVVDAGSSVLLLRHHSAQISDA
jgi:hypothetical protein